MSKSTINPAVVVKHSTDIAALKNDLGIVEDGDTATHTIAQGQYVIWQGVLYTADAAIASGTTLAASGGNKNLTAVPNGGLNVLNSKIKLGVGTIQYDGSTTNNFVHNCGFSDTNYVFLFMPNTYSRIPAIAKPVDGNTVSITAFDWSNNGSGASATNLRIISAWSGSLSFCWIAIKL